MPLRSHESTEEASINLTPMIDVVMLLIIFFMVGSRFTTDRERQFQVELPTVTQAQPLTARPDEIVVNIDRGGNFYLGDQPVTVAELKTRLVAAKANYADQAVTIRGDGQGNYQPIMDVMSICHEADIHNIKLANKLKSDSIPQGGG